MLIYICCAGGATSSLFCQKIGEAADTDKKILVDHILIMLNNLDTYLKEYDMIFAYGPADILRECNLIETGLKNKIASIWIAPQVRYMAPTFQQYFAPLHIPVEVIDMHTFGIMDGKKAYQDIIAKLP